MQISMYDASVPVFVRFLTALSAILKKAAGHCAAKKIEPSVMTAYRLAPDMFALARQVQIATDHAKGAAARLSGSEIPSFPDIETTFDELQARIAKTLDYIQSVKPEQINGSEEREIVLVIGAHKYPFVGKDYLLHFAVPNFFFHVTTAYDILRHAGLDIGKRDFMGAPATK